MAAHDLTGSQRDRRVQVVLVVEGIANVVVLLVKVAVGISTGSIAILGDALHSLADVATNAVGYFIVRASERPADEDHPYGHRKFETIAVFVLATTLAVLAVELVLGAVRDVSHRVRRSSATADFHRTKCDAAL